RAFDGAALGEKARYTYVRCDIASAGDRERLFETVQRQFGGLNVLVNNAGVAPATRLDILETTPENFSRVMDINVQGTFFMCQAGARLLTETAKKTGENTYIVNISSMSAYTSSVSRGEYCISKAGVSMITKLFADRMAEGGVIVNEIRPGIIMTDMTAPVRGKYEKLIEEGVTPIKRFGQPADIARAAVAMTSGAFDFTTGQSVEADGGFHIRRL
ncbi:MAG: 3-ketoacyl-ACP reductase, partial [Clostridiales bacterium]|nr:3-ketoacyl-ACP reductase [Clostridiales bacterium]